MWYKLSLVSLFAAAAAFAQPIPAPLCQVSGSQTSGYVLTATDGGHGCSWQSVGGASVDATTAKNAQYCPDTSVSANTITCSTSTTFPTLAAGQMIRVKVANTITGATTIAVSGGSSKAVTKFGTTALAAGNLVANNEYLAVYDGTEWQVINPRLIAADFPTLNQATTSTAANLSGTPALPNGTTATTQSPGDNTTKLATTAYALAAAALRGAAAEVVSVSFSATPTFTCGSNAVATITTFNVASLTANITSSTLANCTSGQILNFVFPQDSTGGRTVVLPTGFPAAIISPTASKTTMLSFMWDGTTARYPNSSDDTQSIMFLSERAAPGTPASGAAVCWPDSTDHGGIECKANNSANIFKLVLSGVDINPVTGQVTSGSHITDSSIPNTGLVHPSITVAGHLVALGGTQAIACADLSNGAGGCSMSTTAGGDLSGTLPSPTVAAVNGAAVPQSAAFVATNSSRQITALTATAATALLNAMVGDSGSGGTKGLAPAPATGDAAAGKFLKADGTWAVPSGGGSGCTTSGSNHQVLTDNGSGGCTSDSTFTATAGVLAAGSDNSAAGTLQLANAGANAHTIWGSGATTSNTILGFATVPTTGHLIDVSVSSTTATLHDSGVVTANVVNASSPGAGIAHFAGSTQTVTSSSVVNADIAASTIDLTAKVTGLLPTGNMATAPLTRTIGCSFDGGGSTITTNSICYARVPVGATIIGWAIEAVGSSPACTIDVLKVASGTALPTSSITASAIPALTSTDNAVKSTTLTSWTTSMAANDILGFKVTVPGAATWASIDLYYTVN